MGHIGPMPKNNNSGYAPQLFFLINTDLSDGEFSTTVERAFKTARANVEQPFVP
jgi:hypothetical protein